MSMLYDEGQQAIAIESRRVLDARTSTERLLAALEQVGTFDQPFWDTAVEQGWSALAIPEQHGGLGLGLVELGLVAQACGAATAGAPFLTANYGFGEALRVAGNTALQDQWLSRLADGTALAAIAFGEGNAVLPDLPQTGFANGVLNGVKPGVVAGTNADVALVWASHAGQPALVVAPLDGVARDAVDSFDNSRLYADLPFVDCPGVLLAEGPAARRIALDVLARMSVVVAHEQVGGAEALLFIARDYALTRKAFGQPIGAFQSVKHKIAELYGLVEIARANCIAAAAGEGRPGFLRAAAAARISATEAYDAAARDCVQVHGGIGVTWEAGLHLHMRRTRSLAIETGNLFFWEDVLVDDLTGEAA